MMMNECRGDQRPPGVGSHDFLCGLGGSYLGDRFWGCWHWWLSKFRYRDCCCHWKKVLE